MTAKPKLVCLVFGCVGIKRVVWQFGPLLTSRTAHACTNEAKYGVNMLWAISVVLPVLWRHGDVQDVVFPCGYTVAEDGDTINLYYGAADSSTALAHGSTRCLLIWLDASEHKNDRRHE